MERVRIMPIIIRNIFEDYCKEKFDVNDCVAVNNGSSALIAPLWSMDLQPGDEVITTPFTFISTSTSITIAGGTPVFVDIKEDYNLDESLIEKKITKKTKAIIVTHIYSFPNDMDKILKICKKNEIGLVQVFSLLSAKFISKVCFVFLSHFDCDFD